MTNLKTWISSFRLRTLPLAFSSIIMAAFLAASREVFDVVICALTLITTLFLQVLSNLANDYGDAKSGVDGDQRKGPSRTVQSGQITQRKMKIAVLISSTLAFVSGVALILYAFPDSPFESLAFVLLGLGAIAAAIKYTVGSNPYGYAGFGDLFVLIFFGYVGVLGSYYLYSGVVETLLLLPATSCGLFAVAVLNVNNIRDIESDRVSGKFSIPVRIGRKMAVAYHWALLVIGFGSGVFYGFLRSSKPGSGFSF